MMQIGSKCLPIQELLCAPQVDGLAYLDADAILFADRYVVGRNGAGTWTCPLMIESILLQTQTIEAGTILLQGHGQSITSTRL